MNALLSSPAFAYYMLAAVNGLVSLMLFWAGVRKKDKKFKWFAFGNLCWGVCFLWEGFMM